MITILFSVDRKSKYKDTADEIRCPWNQLALNYNFIQANPQKRYVIITKKIEDYNKLIHQVDLLKQTISNYTIQCETFSDCSALIDEGYNAYFKYPVPDWETFTALQAIGVSDIVIDGSIGFQCGTLSRKKKDTLIRFSPTVSLNSAIFPERPPTSFFVRPEDLQTGLYNSAFDIVDFQEKDIDKENTLFQIYKRGNFIYDINNLIKGLPANVNNLLFEPEFAKKRLNCGQQCMATSKCHYCEHYFKVIQQFKDLAKVQREKQKAKENAVPNN